MYVDCTVDRAGTVDATAGAAVIGAGIVVVCAVVVVVDVEDVAGLGAVVIDV